MDNTERQVIDELFGKVKQAESGSGPRDPQAEAHIREHVAAQPAAPYYMSQAIVIQEQALAASQARIEELEAELAQRPAAGGGFLGGLFGGGAPARPSPARRGPVAGMDPRISAYNDPHRRQGGGFLGGAMQTAMGVAGGLLLGSAIMSMLAPDAAAAAEPAPEEAPEEMDAGGFDEEF
ncbi:MAG TPA: DUF2076 domain-containing protein [Rhodospirillales bacterium]|nr:DUF2076 domain-containing protein [Rhodospirillales bacterium]